MNSAISCLDLRWFQALSIVLKHGVECWHFDPSISPVRYHKPPDFFSRRASFRSPTCHLCLEWTGSPRWEAEFFRTGFNSCVNWKWRNNRSSYQLNMLRPWSQDCLDTHQFIKSREAKHFELSKLDSIVYWMYWIIVAMDKKMNWQSTLFFQVVGDPQFHESPEPQTMRQLFVIRRFFLLSYFWLEKYWKRYAVCGCSWNPFWSPCLLFKKLARKLSFTVVCSFA